MNRPLSQLEKKSNFFLFFYTKKSNFYVLQNNDVFMHASQALAPPPPLPPDGAESAIYGFNFSLLPCGTISEADDCGRRREPSSLYKYLLFFLRQTYFPKKLIDLLLSSQTQHFIFCSILSFFFIISYKIILKIILKIK